MGDINGRQIVFFLHFLDEAQNLRLNGHIQRGGGFIADEDFWLAGHGDGNDHTLAHTAGKFVGILVIAALGVADAHLGQNFIHRFFCGVPVDVLMQLHRLPNLPADGFQRVEAGHGILQHHGDAMATQGAPLRIGLELGKVLAVIENFAALHIAVGIVEAHQALDKDAFAGTGLPHDGKAFAFIHIQRDAAQRVEHLPPQRKFEIQILHRQEDLLLFHCYVLLTHGSWGRQRPQRRCPPHTARW